MTKEPPAIAALLESAIDIKTDDSDPAARLVAERLDLASRRYRRIPDGTAPADGLVIVGIGWEPQLRPLANPTASLSWTALHGHDLCLEPDSEGPYHVLEAFARAHDLASRYGSEIVVSIQSPSHWRDAWGTLVEDDDV